MTRARPILEKSPLILVVDDEDLVREVVCIMIQESGGVPITAVDGASAVAAFKQRKQEIAAVIVDFSMPEMNGYETYLELVQEDRNVRVLMVTGLRLNTEAEALVRQKRIWFLPKPFHEAELIGVLKEMVEK